MIDSTSFFDFVADVLTVPPLILKIAVEMLNAPDKVPQLIEFDQSQPLSSIIQLLCKPWGLPDPENYALQFSESNNQNYITEKNRNEIKNGSVLRLELSPAKTVQDILAKINSGAEVDQVAALSKLSVLSSDLTFVNYTKNILKTERFIKTKSFPEKCHTIMFDQSVFKNQEVPV